MKNVFFVLFFVYFSAGCSSIPSKQANSAEPARVVASETKTFSDQYRVGFYIKRISYVTLEENDGKINGSVAVPWLHQSYDSSYKSGTPAIIENVSPACLNLIQTAWMGVSSLSNMKIWLIRDSREKKSTCITSED